MQVLHRRDSIYDGCCLYTSTGPHKGNGSCLSQLNSFRHHKHIALPKKVRMQTIHTPRGEKPANFVRTGVQIVRSEGILALYKGIHH